jgi:5-methylcytosine-specific restriction protein A
MRSEFSRKVRAAIVARANGKCEHCWAVLKPSEGEVDHILPDAMGGKPEARNGRLICQVCHKAKTAADVRQIRKADRQRDKASGAIRPVGKLKGRGFPAPKPKSNESRHPKMEPKRLFERTAP